MRSLRKRASLRISESLRRAKLLMLMVAKANVIKAILMFFITLLFLRVNTWFYLFVRQQR